MEAKVGRLRFRSYQTEMFERSKLSNSIIVMDTGSGKTAIALLRITTELDVCPPNKYIWFLAPTVVLCQQQRQYLSSYLPAIKMRIILGSDNVERWSTQSIWDSVLDTNRVIVSTYAILADALTHGFVRMAQLHLLVFDEAHVCTKKHPAKMIANRYHEAKEQGLTPLPHILGLTASPIYGSKLSDLQKIEASLDAITITPRIHRNEFLTFVHRPKFYTMTYAASSVEKDPNLPDFLIYLQQLAAQKDWQHGIEHLKKFVQKVCHIHEELGVWAAGFFVWETINVLRDTISTQIFGTEVKAELLRVLSHPSLRNTFEVGSLPNSTNMSEKLRILTHFLGERNPEDCAGLIFATQRATVGVLQFVLSNHPQTKGRFKFATFVGTSNNAKKKYLLSELFDLKAQKEVIDEFRSRAKNIVIATDVLEEGIDISACNLVVCFNAPPNLKSFIQRRGRARHEKSEFVVFRPNDDNRADIGRWLHDESRLIEHYQKEAEERSSGESSEDEDEEDMKILKYALEVKATGAKVTADHVVGHLHHFCAKISSDSNSQPEFAVESANGQDKLFTASVVLPGYIHSSLRKHSSHNSWKRKKLAIKDAAFQAYHALFRARLLNDHLLPLVEDWPEEVQIPSERVLERVSTGSQLNVWKSMAREWNFPRSSSIGVLYETKITIEKIGGVPCTPLSLIFTTPLLMKQIPPVSIPWNDQEVIFKVSFDCNCSVTLKTTKWVTLLQQTTDLILASVRPILRNFQHNSFLFFSPANIPEGDLESWLSTSAGTRPALDVYRSMTVSEQSDFGSDELGLLRLSSRPQAAHKVLKWTPSLDSQGMEIIKVECAKVSLRLFSDATSEGVEQAEPLLRTTRELLADECEMDNLPSKYATFNFLIPDILRHVELAMMAHELRVNVLPKIGIQNIHHLMEAVLTPKLKLSWLVDYQRCEFIGDTVLKFVISAQLFFDHELWTEEYLTRARAALVSNSTLENSAFAVGLDSYIVTKLGPRGKKWRPLNILDCARDVTEHRTLPMKQVADVVEALVGAAFVDSGLEAARRCIVLFLPSTSAFSPQFIVPLSMTLPNHVENEETAIGYTFRNKKLLLEALTHRSLGAYTGSDCYERLEFLGDAVLDFMIVSCLSSFKNLSEADMTMIKAALVNGNFLGFLCLQHNFKPQISDIISTNHQNNSTQPLELWKFLRHHPDSFVEIFSRTSWRFNTLGCRIWEQLSVGHEYPWADLVKLAPSKVYSDLIESVLGAIYIDTGGSSLAECEGFLNRLGVFDLARRYASVQVDLRHPKARLVSLLPPGTKIDSQYETRPQVQYFHGTDAQTYESTGIRCKILTNQEIGKSEWCESKEAASVLAADHAVHRIKAERYHKDLGRMKEIGDSPDIV